MKQKLIKSWKEALSKFIQKKYYDSSLNEIQSALIENGIITIDCINVRYEASLESLAALQGRTAEDLQEEYENMQSFELIEQLGYSLFHQDSVKRFFNRLYDVYITKSNLFVCDIEVSDWVLELQNEYTIIWHEVSNIPVPPFPGSLDDYALSYMASSK